MLGGSGGGAKIWRRAAKRIFGIVIMHATQCAGDFARANAIVASAIFLAGICVVASLVYIFGHVGFVLSPGFIPLWFPSLDDFRHNGFVGFRPLRLVLVGQWKGLNARFVSRAILANLFTVLLLPCLLFALIMFIALSSTRGFLNESFPWAMWFLIGHVSSCGWLYYGYNQLTTKFRSVAAGERPA